MRDFERISANEGDNDVRFEHEQGQIVIGLFDAGLDAIDLFDLGLFGGEFSWVFAFHGLEFLGGFVDGGFKGFIRVGSVNEKSRKLICK
ncbi:hypothetical protein WN943_013405 [Citrus x changshan-huyou]